MNDSQKLDREELHQILKEHTRYNSSAGKEGQQADLSGYIIENFDFRSYDLENIIHARESIFLNCCFKGCDLYGIYFNGSSLVQADFSNVVLSKSEFHGADASGACFDDAKMTRVEFINTKLCGASFRNSDLHSATILIVI